MSGPLTSTGDVIAPHIPLHLYLSKLIDDSEDLTNAEIARRLGYPRPNVIAMMRTGTMKIPLNKVPAIAEILGLEPVALLQRALREYDPELWKTFESCMGRYAVTQNEVELLKLLRHQAAGMDPDLAQNELFVEGFKALIRQAVDVEVARQLAARPTQAARRVSEASEVNGQLEELCRRQAEERMALRRQLIDGSDK